MKKLGLLVVPLMAISFLASCDKGGDNPPTPPIIKQFTVTFDANGGTLSGESSIKVDEGTSFKDITNKPTASKEPTDAYAFEGWALSETSQEAIDDYEITSNLTVYAIYTPKAYTSIIFSENSSECTLQYNDKTYYKGESLTVPAGIDVTLTINSTAEYFPILEGDVKITDAESYSFNLVDKEIIVKVDKDKKCVIEANAEKGPRENLDDYSWSEISQLSKMNLATTCFKVGDTKDVLVNGVTHKVRIIGFNQDKDKNGNDIGITFEFATLISDENGYSIATQWNDTDDSTTASHNYLDSSVRMALVGEKQEKGHILWGRKGETAWSTNPNYDGKTILDMLPEKLTKVLVAPQKTVQCYGDEGWVDQPIVNEDGEYDKLFLLSYKEIGYFSSREGAYAYYQEKEASKIMLLRIKKQVENTECQTCSVILKDDRQIFKSSVNNYAGYNYKVEETNGGKYWLRSPYVEGNYNNFSWHVDKDGLPTVSHTVSDTALEVAPAFCI